MACLGRYHRALHEPIYLVGHEHLNPTMVQFLIQNEKSNKTYQILYDSQTHQFSCNCPDFTNREQSCKHIYCLFFRVLQRKHHDAEVAESYLLNEQFLEEVSPEFILQWQRSGEPAQTQGIILPTPQSASSPPRNIDEDCAVCFEALDLVNSLWCCKTCSNAIHQGCWSRWKVVNRSTCPFCRTLALK